MPSEVSVKSEEKKESEETDETGKWLGMTVRNQTGQRKGVIVDAVESGSVADLSGIQQGDIILKIDKYDIESVKDFSNAREQLKNIKKPILFRLRRGNTSLFIAVNPE